MERLGLSLVLASVAAIGCRGISPDWDGSASDTGSESASGYDGGTGGDTTGGDTTGGGATGGGTSDTDDGSPGDGSDSGSSGDGSDSGTSGDESDSDNSSDGSDAGSSSEIVPGCGNGVVDPGETCDDGDDDETDDCTTLCEPPSCEDELLSGDESAQDCGGSCEPCVAGQSCFEHGDCEAVACIGDLCADGLIPIDCSEEANLQSTDSNTSTDVTWVNISGEVRKTFWLDYQGSRVYYTTIQPEDLDVQHTFVTHPWVITDADDNCIQIFMPADTPSDAYLS